MGGALGLGFTAPWLLLGLLALPVVWLLLRAVPPTPLRRIFPPVVLLLGLTDESSQADRTPWWLLLIRLGALAALIAGFAGPVLNPRASEPGTRPLLILLDGTWADATDWPARLRRVEAALEEARQAARPVAVVTLVEPPPPGELPFLAADEWLRRLGGLRPRPWQPDPEAVGAWAAALGGSFDSLWLSDGLDRPGRAELLRVLQEAGSLIVAEGGLPLLGLREARYEEGGFVLEAVRSVASAAAAEVSVEAVGSDPAGRETVLARAPLRFAPGRAEAELRLELPLETGNRVSRFVLRGQRSAAAVRLADDSLKRRKVALVSGVTAREGLRLLSPSHYLRNALAPGAELIEATLGDSLLAGPDVIVLADVARLAPAEADALEQWVRAGGMLLRFAGPRLAASDVGRGREDPLMPVRLRVGGRSIGGAMSWGTPRSLRPFAEGSPFFGLPVPADVSVSAQVLAEPDPELARRVMAALDDGTPLVTRKRLGRGQVVLFHVTASAQWSTLPLSGLFVQMLERLVAAGPSDALAAQAPEGSDWVPVVVLDAFGTLRAASALAGVPGERLARAPLGAAMPPGLYEDEARARRLARNVLGPGDVLSPARWPETVRLEGLSGPAPTDLKPPLLVVALGLLLLDALAALWLGGRLRRLAGPLAGGLVLAVSLAALALSPAPVLAQGDSGAGSARRDALALEATTQTVLAHVLTGNAQVDRVARAGLRGLSDVLFARTSVEPAPPIGVDLERDELAFFPFLYWPVTPDQPTPSPEAYARLNRYLRSGGMILFDTRDGDVAGSGVSSPGGRRLQQLALPLDVPPLEPLPDDHVLTRSFYLLRDFPGRHASGKLWVEAAPPDVERAEGMPFRNLNDNVSPVVIGGNDWAAAWAVDRSGAAMFPVGRGRAGARQRELAYRFGVNLIMYVLTGNYKSDQVHVPALLERLGQ